MNKQVNSIIVQHALPYHNLPNKVVNSMKQISEMNRLCNGEEQMEPPNWHIQGHFRMQES